MSADGFMNHCCISWYSEHFDFAIMLDHWWSSGIFKNISSPAWITVLVMLIPGVLLASDLKLSLKVVLGIPILFSLLLGLLNGITMPNMLEINGVQNENERHSKDREKTFKTHAS
jgi:hypothetical protein